LKLEAAGSVNSTLPVSFVMVASVVQLPGNKFVLA